MTEKQFVDAPVRRIRLANGGAVLDWRQGSGTTVEIYDIHVELELRRHGWGRKLLEELFKVVPPGCLVWAVTRAENEPAQEFYEATKFRVVGVLRRFYEQKEYGVDAVMYGRSPRGSV